MSTRFPARRWTLAAALPLLASIAAPLAAQDSLVALLRRNAHPMQAGADGRLSGAGADVLLAEASFETGVDNPPDLHLTGADCGRTAARAGVGRLVLTHVPPWHDPAVAEAEARDQWSGPIEVARAGATYDV